MKYDVFISYSSKDQKVVEALSHYLEENKIRCFVAYRDIPKGKVWAAAITEAIEDCQMMVVMFSEYFNSSDQVDREIEMCSEEKKPILTYRITDTNFKGAKKYYLKNLNWIDAFPDPESSFGELLNSICRLIDVEPRQVVSNDDSSDTTEEYSKYFNLKIKPDADCAVYVDDEKVADVVSGKIARLELRKGTYSLRFESKLYPSFSKEEIYRVENVDMEELLVLEIKDEILLSIPDDQLEPYICEGGCGFKYNDVKVLSLRYNYAYSFNKGLARVYLNGKCGFIDKSGKEITPLKYDSVYDFSKGLARVYLKGKYGFIDKRGNEITSLKYESADNFSEGLASVRLNWKSGYIDKRGKEIIPLKYDIAGTFSEGLACVCIDGHGFIDKSGTEIIPLKYDNAFRFSEGLASVALNGKWGFVDKRGSEVIPLKYDSVDAWFREGLASVELNGKCSFIDKSGREVISLKYDRADSFNEGLAGVRLNGKCGFIDKSGREVIPLKYDIAVAFSEGLSNVKLNGKRGFIDKSGREVIPIKYDDAFSFSEGFARVELNRKWGLVDKRGNEVIPLKYQSVGFSKGLVHVRLNGKEGYIDREGNEYWE